MLAFLCHQETVCIHTLEDIAIDKLVLLRPLGDLAVEAFEHFLVERGLPPVSGRLRRLGRRIGYGVPLDSNILVFDDLDTHPLKRSGG